MTTTNPEVETEIGYVGTFWLAPATSAPSGTSTPPRSTAGTLSLNVGSPQARVEMPIDVAGPLVGKMTTADGVTTLAAVSPPGDVPPFTLHADIEFEDGPRPVTLVGCVFSTWTVNISAQPVTISGMVQADYALLGMHGGQDTAFSQARMQFEHLQQWIEGAPSEVDKAATLATGGNVYISSRGANGGDATPWIALDGLQDRVFRLLDREYLVPLSSLLTFCTGVACSPCRLELATRTSGWCEVTSKWLQPPPAPSINDRAMLLPLSELRISGVADWLNSVNRFGPYPAVLAEHIARPSHTVEVEVLVLTTAAEGISRRLWPEDIGVEPTLADKIRVAAVASVSDLGKDAETLVNGAFSHLREPSFGARLKKIASAVQPTMDEALGRLTISGANPWKNLVYDARNDLAHGLVTDWLAEETIDRYLVAMLSLRWILMGLLLLESGLPANVLAKRLEGHGPYRIFLRQVGAWLPSLYGSRQA